MDAELAIVGVPVGEPGRWRPVQLDLKEMCAWLEVDKEGRVLGCQKDLPITQAPCEVWG